MVIDLDSEDHSVIMMSAVSCHTVEMVTRLHYVTMIARCAVGISTGKVVQFRVIVAARVEC